MAYRAFKRDPYALLRHNLIMFVVYAALCVAAWWLIPRAEMSWPWAWVVCVALVGGPLLTMNILGCVGVLGLYLIGPYPAFSASHVMMVLLGIYAGLVSPALMHNAAHYNIRPKWLCVLIGEGLALHQLVGYKEWTILHTYHHAHPDDPERDPHPPLDSSFLKFALRMKGAAAAKFEKYYFEIWGDAPGYRKILGMTGVMIILNGMVRSAFWFLALGPLLYVVFFIVSYVTTNFVYCHFNYYTHRARADGGHEAVNLDDTWYYKLLNSCMWGVYYHKNHHLRPNTFNPKHVPRRVLPQAESEQRA